MNSPGGTAETRGMDSAVPTGLKSLPERSPGLRPDCMTASAPSSQVDWLLPNDHKARKKEPSMMIIGCDFHPRFQQIAFVDEETGECGERRLSHPEEAERFYRSLAGRRVCIGVEATGNFRWFRQLMHELGHEFLLGNPGAIRASSPRR